MFPRVRTVASLVAFSFCVSMVVPACNLSPVLGVRQLSEEQSPVAYEARLTGGDPATQGVDIHLVAAHEVDLVEGVVEHRAEYHRRLKELREYYLAHGHHTKATWADFELDGLRRVKTFQFLLDAEVPSTALTSSESIPEADILYERALDILRRGGHGIPVLYRRDLMIEAAGLLRELIEGFPMSDKIDDAAFYCGEIHKEYLPGLEPIAVKWYERAWTWDPHTPHPARFQAAVVYDYRLRNRDRALELYHWVVTHETARKSNLRFATRRINELTTPHSTESVATR